MDLEQAYEVAYVSSEERASVERYLGFKHTMINILSDLKPETYKNLTHSGWYFPQTEEEVKQAIEDFVNIYATMYKESRNKKLYKHLIRGTSNKNVNSLNTSIPQLLSTSTDVNVAKTFCTYQDVALIHFNVGEGVPFLNAEEYRDENRANEGEIILAPFCRISRKVFSGKYDGYSNYDITIQKPFFEIKSKQELSDLFQAIVSGFAQNIEDMKEYNYQGDRLEVLYERTKRAQGNIEDLTYIGEEIDKAHKNFDKLQKSTNTFRLKLQSLLKGLCKQKELDIDKANELIEEDIKARREELEKKRQEDEARKKLEQEETTRKKLIDELSSKLSNGPHNATSLESTVIKTYQDLITIETKARNLAKTLGVDFVVTSTTNINKKVTEIQENISAILSKIDETTVDENDSLEGITQTSKKLTPLLDGLNYGLEISGDFPEIVNMHRLQVDGNIKRSLHFKVQSVMQNARIQKYLQEKDAINSEVIGFFGRLTGKDILKSEKLKNINLKIQLAQSAVPGEQKNYSSRDMLAEMYACAITELGGAFTPEMSKLYSSIKATYRDTKTGEFSNEYIKQLASKKIMESRQANLPAVASKKPGFFRKIKSQIDTLRVVNEGLQRDIAHNMGNKNKWIYSNNEPNAIALFEQKLKGIAFSTRQRDAFKTKTDLEQTFDLWEM